MATRRRKSKRFSFLKMLVFLVEAAILVGALYFVFGLNPQTQVVPATPSEVQTSEQTTESVTDVTAESTAEATVEPTQEPTPEPTPEATPVPDPPKALRLHQINVACANAYLLQYGDVNIFIDGGEYRSLKNVTAYLDGLGVDHISMYIGTHWHGDHVDNAAEILTRYGDETTKVLGVSETTNGLESNLKKRVYSKSSARLSIPEGNYVQFKPGMTINVGKMQITCVGPYTVKNGNSNYDSMNFLIEYGDFSAFMTGDYVHSKQVMAEYADLIANVDVLQMPHHGLDPIYISESALTHASPEVVLVPANSAGPTRKMVKNCGLDATVYDNKNGNIAVISYGTGYEVKTNVVASEFTY